MMISFQNKTKQNSNNVVTIKRLRVSEQCVGKNQFEILLRQLPPMMDQQEDGNEISNNEGKTVVS